MKKFLFLFLIFNNLSFGQNMIIAGAGSSQLDGTYIRTGLIFGKPQYQHNNDKIFWDGSKWLITFGTVDISGPIDNQYYYSNDNVVSPNLCGTWNLNLGSAPAPNVSRVCNNGIINSITTVTACGSFTWSNTGATYSASGNYTGTLNNCIQQTLNLTILPSLTATVEFVEGTTCVGSTGYFKITGTPNAIVNYGLNLGENSAEIASNGEVLVPFEIVSGSNYINLYSISNGNCAGSLEENSSFIGTSLSNNYTNETACGSYTWSNTGETYTESGTYYGSTTNCATEVLNLTINPIPSPSISITTTDLDYTICSGTNVMFTSNASNGGSSPSYQWKVDGVNVNGQTGSTFSTSTLTNGQIVTVQMLSNAVCASTSPVVSNEIQSFVVACTQLQASQCGITLTSNSLSINANTVSGATNYRFEVSGPNGYLQVITKPVSFFFLSDLTNYESGQTYSIKVCTSLNNGLIYGPYGSACTLTTFHPTTQLQVSQCGITLTSNTSIISANAVTGATNYRFEVSGPNGYLQVVNKISRSFYLSNLPTYEFGQTYSIKVSTSLNNGLIYGPYGSACSLTTFHPITQIQTSQCGATLTNNNTAISASNVTGATNYRFEVTGPNGYFQVINKTIRTFYLSDLPTYQLGQTYSIRVQVSVNGGAIYGPYGSVCSITTFHPTTKIQTSQCGAILTNNASAITANNVTGATNYRFEVSGPNGYFQVVSKTVRSLFLSDLPTYQAGQTYSIRVQVSMNNGVVYGPFGAACNITTKATIALNSGGALELKSQNLNYDFEANPNPSNGSIVLTSSEPGTFNIINQLGALVKTVQTSEENGNQIKVEDLPNGAYFITGTLNGKVLTKKVIVIR